MPKLFTPIQTSGVDLSNEQRSTCYLCEQRSTTARLADMRDTHTHIDTHTLAHTHIAMTLTIIDRRTRKYDDINNIVKLAFCQRVGTERKLTQQPREVNNEILLRC